MATILLGVGIMGEGCSRGAASTNEPPNVRATDMPARATAASASSAAHAASSGNGRSGGAAPANASSSGGALAAKSATLPAARLHDFNVVLITIDSLRADMPWAGYPRPITPNLTELEKQSVSYTHAYSLSSYTSMSVGGIMGGRYPGEMKRSGYFFGTYHKDNLMLAERLHAAGVRTMAAHAHGYFRVGASGLEQGFDVYELVPNLKWNPNTDENVTSPALESIAEKMLSDPANTSGKFFAWFHFLDPHDQYKTHPDVPSFGNKARDRYDGEVAFTDRYVGKLVSFLRAQPWGARTAIIISADHGEAFGEHGMYRHAFELWQMLVRVPWMFLVPGVSPRHIDVNRSHIDLAPTILDLMGVAFEGLDGKSLVPEIAGEATPEPRDVIVDLPRTSNNDRRRALIHGNRKLIAFGDDKYFEVFDLDQDPGELHSIRKTDPDGYKEMVDLYKKESKAIADVGPYACRKLMGAPEGRGW